MKKLNKPILILAEETTAASGTAQLTSYTCYFREVAIRELFYFDEMHEFSGIASHILIDLKKSGIDMGYVVAQGCNGAARMSGIRNGEQKHIRDECPAAVYSWVKQNKKYFATSNW